MKIAKIPRKTKDKLLDAAEQLMLKKGYPATAVDEICEVAEVTKGSFFHYFESKEDLGKAVLDRFCSSKYEALSKAKFLKEPDPLKRIFGYIDFMIQQVCECSEGQRGCLLGNFAQELSDTYPEIGTCCSKYFAEWIERFKSDLDIAAKYSRNENLDTRSLAEFFVSIVEGSLILAKANRDYQICERNLKQFRRYIEILFKSKQ
ncbi:MAG: TetR/AcrR family transcriptional regulator [Planctomycetes bacterium]|nr:TetR/AcrR family transcriptional regulator [Planctomycetota bacterium]